MSRNHRGRRGRGGRKGPESINLGKQGSIEIKHPGALHEQMGVPQGEKIPAAKLEAAAHSDDALKAKRARLALTMRSWHHGGRKSA